VLAPTRGPLLVWGTYDVSKPNVRQLLAGIRAVGVEVHEVHADIWAGVRDKGTLTRGEQLRAAWRWLAAMPRLVRDYLAAPPHAMVLVPYLGLFDLLMLLPFTSFRGTPVVWQVFISPYDTAVNDRRMLSRWNPLAWILYACEWVAVRAADRAFIDTPAHARRFEAIMGVAPQTVGDVPLGTDPARFPPRAGRPTVHAPLRVFFYGQYIPLHGLETIVRAAKRLEEAGVAVRWELAGTGQEQPRITALIAELGVRSVTQLGWIDAAEIPGRIHACDVGLGIFGTSGKAITVIPNKAYEIAATQTPLISGDTPALATFAPGHPWVLRVAPGDDAALAACVAGIVARGAWPDAPPMPVIGAREVGEAFLRVVDGLA
jgi:glycosyltransferase involved in cell wall biosynthesis